MAAWAAISGLLMLFANLWLQRYPNGPFEGVWKRLVSLAKPKANWLLLGSPAGFVVPDRFYQPVEKRIFGSRGDGGSELDAALRVILLLLPEPAASAQSLRRFPVGQGCGYVVLLICQQKGRPLYHFPKRQ